MKSIKTHIFVSALLLLTVRCLAMGTFTPDIRRVSQVQARTRRVIRQSSDRQFVSYGMQQFALYELKWTNGRLSDSAGGDSPPDPAPPYGNASEADTPRSFKRSSLFFAIHFPFGIRRFNMRFFHKSL